MSGILITMCVCKTTSFASLLPQARAQGWDVAAIGRETGCGASCGRCRPYLRRMLETGETVFRELLHEDPAV